MSLCSWANAAAAAFIILNPGQPKLYAAVYALTDGPLAGALIVWQSAWVFGSASHSIRSASSLGCALLNCQQQQAWPDASQLECFSNHGWQKSQTAPQLHTHAWLILLSSNPECTPADNLCLLSEHGQPESPRLFRAAKHKFAIALRASCAPQGNAPQEANRSASQQLPVATTCNLSISASALPRGCCAHVYGAHWPDNHMNISRYMLNCRQILMYSSARIRAYRHICHCRCMPSLVSSCALISSWRLHADQLLLPSPSSSYVRHCLPSLSQFCRLNRSMHALLDMSSACISHYRCTTKAGCHSIWHRHAQAFHPGCCFKKQGESALHDAWLLHLMGRMRTHQQMHALAAACW